MNEFPDVSEFYVNASLYTEFDINQTNKQLVFDTVYYMNPIDCYCIECSANSVFKPEANRIKVQGLYGFSSASESFQDAGINPLTTSLIIQKTFSCSRNSLHKLHFFIQINNGKISKVGQTPALADIAEQEIRKFKKILGASQYQEFSKAIGLYTHGVGVGSFVYLRRIIENFIIKPAYDKACETSTWDDTLYQKSRVKDKIDLLKDELPTFLVDNPIIYSIISKGIHELTENECKQYFSVLKTCLEFVLTDLEAKRETEKKRKEMQETLGKIAGEIK